MVQQYPHLTQKIKRKDPDRLVEPTGPKTKSNAMNERSSYDQ